jgi:hypothetical protein
MRVRISLLVVGASFLVCVPPPLYIPYYIVKFKVIE